MHTDISLLKAADFKDLTNDDFWITFTETARLQAKLIEIIEFETLQNNGRKPFSVVFEAAQKNGYYPQSIYKVEHPALGVLSIFLVPLGFNKTGMKYEAVFS